MILSTFILAAFAPMAAIAGSTSNKAAPATNTKAGSNSKAAPAAASPTAVSSRGGVSSVCPSPDMCFIGTTDNAGNAIITVQAKTSGWVAFGINNKRDMVGADMYIAWLNSTGGVVLSTRRAADRVLPTVANDPKVALVAKPAAIAPLSSANVNFSFKRPITSNLPINDASFYLFASANSPPSTPDNPASPFNIHNSFGFLDNFNPSASLTAANPAGKSAAVSLSKSTLAILAIPAIAVLML